MIVLACVHDAHEFMFASNKMVGQIPGSMNIKLVNQSIISA